MKKLKKTLAVLMSVILIFGCMSVISFAADGTVTVKLRIEGITECLYYGKVSAKNGATVLDVVKTADELDKSLTVNVVDSYYGDYISGINGIYAGAYTTLGWDGWSYLVNSVSPDVGVSQYTVKDGDSVVLFYGDPWNTGMQYPVINTKDLGNGKIAVTSNDTVYEAPDYTPVTKECPVANCTVVWEFLGGKIKLTTDENGICTIPDRYLSYGTHSVQIERYDSTTSLPTVLRLEPDYSVNVDIFTALPALIRAIMQFISSLK